LPSTLPGRRSLLLCSTTVKVQQHVRDGCVEQTRRTKNLRGAQRRRRLRCGLPSPLMRVYASARAAKASITFLPPPARSPSFSRAAFAERYRRVDILFEGRAVSLAVTCHLPSCGLVLSRWMASPLHCAGGSYRYLLAVALRCWLWYGGVHSRALYTHTHPRCCRGAICFSPSVPASHLPPSGPGICVFSTPRSRLAGRRTWT